MSRSIRKHVIRIYEQKEGYSLYAGSSSELVRQPLDYESSQISKSYLLSQKRLDDVLAPNKISWSMTFRWDSADSCPIVAYGGYIELPTPKGHSGISFVHAMELYSPDDLHRCVNAVLTSLSPLGIRKLRRALVKAATGSIASIEQSLEIAREVEEILPRKSLYLQEEFIEPKIKRITHDCAGASSVAWQTFAIQQVTAEPPWEVFDFVNGTQDIETIVTSPYRRSLLASDVQRCSLMRYLDARNPESGASKETNEVETQQLTVVREDTDNGAKAIATVRHETIFSQVQLLVVLILLQMLIIALGVYLVLGQRDVMNLLNRIIGTQGSRNDPTGSRTSSSGVLSTTSQSGQPGQEVAQGDEDYLQKIARLYDPEKRVRIAAITELNRSGMVEDRFVFLALGFARTHQENADGLENTLLVLQRAKPDVLKRYKSDVLAFVDSVRLRNSKIAEQANNLRTIVNQP